ncbi:MAG: SigE family RNA polymerase sigma factor [bacterium]|nr:SigE family RNA polymerase sigma factor [bacterium]MCP4965845.1 SigE family RNA polymerase sigma factor [bacterium]
MADTGTVEMDEGIPVVRARESFDQFVGREYRSVLALAHVLTGSPSRAEDLCQEAFVAAYKQWERIDNPEGWIRTVVANKARSWLRRRYSETLALARIGVRSEVTIDEMPADTEHFWAEVRRLPRMQAQAIALFYLEDRTTADIGRILGCSGSTARVHLARGRKTLARRIGAEEEQ